MFTHLDHKPAFSVQTCCLLRRVERRQFVGTLHPEKVPMMLSS